MGRRCVPRGTSPLAITIATATTAGTVVLADVLHARAAQRGHGTRDLAHDATNGYVVLLGSANRGPHINMINRWRSRIAVRSARRHPGVTIICSGGPVRGSVAEAELLHRYLRSSLGWSGRIIVEDESRTTWENVRNVAPLLVDADWIIFASNSLHAERARAYLRRQQPELAARLVPGRDHRWGEMAALKPMFAAVGLWKLARSRAFRVKECRQQSPL